MPVPTATAIQPQPADTSAPDYMTSSAKESDDTGR